MQEITINKMSFPSGNGPVSMETSIGTLRVWADHAGKFKVGGIYEVDTYNKPYNGADQWYVSTKSPIKPLGEATGQPRQLSTAPKPPPVSPSNIIMDCIGIAANMGLPSELEANTRLVQELYDKLTAPKPQEQPQPQSGVGSDLNDPIPF